MRCIQYAEKFSELLSFLLLYASYRHSPHIHTISALLVARTNAEELKAKLHQLVSESKIYAMSSYAKIMFPYFLRLLRFCNMTCMTGKNDIFNALKIDVGVKFLHTTSQMTVHKKYE